MFYIFDEQALKVTKGNSADVLITLTDTNSGLPIAISEGDRVLFTAKNQNGDIVIKRVLTTNDLAEDGHTIILSLIPEETNIATGEYPYDVLLITLDGQAVTFISSTIVIMPAVGLYTDAGGADT